MRKLFPLACLLAFAAAAAAVEMPGLFSNDMVLQRDQPIRLWGKGAPGEKIRAEFAGASAEAEADKDGAWELTLPAQKASAEGLELTVSGANALKFANVLVGDVWLCAGQSNMQYGLSAAIGGTEEIAASANPMLRLLWQPCDWSREPRREFKGKWAPCGPNTVRGFSAVAYFFGKEVAAKAKVPVGLIQAAWGGARVESFTSEKAFAAAEQFPYLRKFVSKEIADARAKSDAELRPDKQRLFTMVYNAMIHPLTPLAIKGVIWYQGEDNHYDGSGYADKLQVLAKCWRDAFREPEMPFYVIQIPPFRYGDDAPDVLPRLWRAQQRFAALDGHAAVVPASDCGDPEDIHPKEKRPLAARLAAMVLFREYGIGDAAAQAPTFAKATFAGGKAVIEFANANGLKTRDGGPVSHLEIAGADDEFVAATGKIVNDRLEVSAPAVKEPRRVRFGWDKLANPNLVNRAGVPALAFDTGKKK